MYKQEKIRSRWVWINRMFFLLVVMFVVMLLMREWQSFSDSVEYFNETTYENMMHEIEHEVDNRVDEIDSVRSEIDVNYRNEVKQLVYDTNYFASEIVMSLGESATLEEKRAAFIDAIYQYDLYDEDYLFFAMDMDGLSYLSGTTKTLEGTDITGLVDQVTGRYFVLDMIDVINNSEDKQGFVTYHWMKVPGGEHLPKTSFVFYNEEVELFFGTGVYDVDLIARVQDELFNRISSYYNYDTKDYVYIIGYDGAVVYHPLDSFDTDALMKIKTPDGESFHDFIVSSLDELDSIEVEYYFDETGEQQYKQGYIRKIEDWDMYLGRSFVIDELLVIQDDYFEKLFFNYVIYNILAAIVVLSLVIVIKKLINQNFRDVQEVFEDQKQMVKEISYRDQLTGIYNRKFFEEETVELLSNREMITAIMIDANGLKLINDAYGHIVGDKLLVEITKIIKNVFNTGHHFRWGGDEFVVILYGLELERVLELIESFQQTSKSHKIKDFSVSASVGYAHSVNPVKDFYRLIDKAESMMYENKSKESVKTKREIIDNILLSLENNFGFEAEHSENVKNYALLLGKKLKFGEEKLSKLRLAALLHDVGKIGIPDSILTKKEKLTDDDIDEIRKHPEKGMRILSAYPELSEYGNFALTHHERYDGKGYPRGLEGNDIPLISRIITIADAFDAMTSYRVYKEAMSVDEALQELIDNKGTQFDSDLVDLFVELIKENPIK